MENKYQNAKIYVLVENACTKQYIGSTCESLSRRRSRHISSYKFYQSTPDKENRFITSFYLLSKFGIENVKIELLENFPCKNKEELRKREGFHIRQNDCVNKCIAGRIVKERQQVWQEQNKEQIKEKKHNYYLENKEYFQEQGKIYRKKHKEHIKERYHNYYYNNREKILKQVKEYSEANKELKANYHKSYYQNNKEKWQTSNQKSKQQITCDCGCVLQKKAVYKHIKSKQHQNYINQASQQTPSNSS